MKLLKLAIETQKWDLAAHVLILGVITARRKHDGKTVSKKRKGRFQGREKQG